MNVSPIAVSAATREVERQVLVMKKHQDVAKTVANSLVALIQNGSPAPPGRIDTYA